ncbi:MAG: DUF4261 domain-containing protein [Helicobacteraceae bacterium]|jgi:hypothetical protein|nr:DUF4261 domain-containing protein [Helicobacteraceae bacterium]
MGGEILRQDLSKSAEHSGVYAINLLFKERVQTPDIALLRERLEAKFGAADIVSGETALASFALPQLAYTTSDGKALPPMIMISACEAIKKPLADGIARTQFWDIENGAELLDSLPFTVIVGDFMARGLEPLARAGMLADWLEIALDLFPSCEAVYFQPSAKLLLPDRLRDNPYGDRGASRFLYGGINIRYFRVDGTNDRVVDTLGLFAFGLADIQYHFRDLGTNAMVGHAFNTALYQFENGEPIKDGNTVEGVTAGEKWSCQYENALIQPARTVLDISAGAYAAGSR